MSGFNDDIMSLLALEREETASNRFDSSDEYIKLYDRVDNKSRIIDIMERDLEFPLEVIYKANKMGIWVEDKRKGLLHIEPEDLTISIQGDIVILHRLSFDDFDYLTGTVGKKYYPDEYMKSWWIKKDKSE